MKCCWSALVAASADDVWATLTLTAAGVTHSAEGALRVTLALWEMGFNRGEELDSEQASTG